MRAFSRPAGWRAHQPLRPGWRGSGTLRLRGARCRGREPGLRRFCRRRRSGCGGHGLPGNMSLGRRKAPDPGRRPGAAAADAGGAAGMQEAGRSAATPHAAAFLRGRARQVPLSARRRADPQGLRLPLPVRPRPRLTASGRRARQLVLSEGPSQARRATGAACGRIPAPGRFARRASRRGRSLRRRRRGPGRAGCNRGGLRLDNAGRWSRGLISAGFRRIAAGQSRRVPCRTICPPRPKRCPSAPSTPVAHPRSASVRETR